MNREIKFRGKRIDNGEWVYGNLFFDFDCTDKYAPFINWKYASYLGGIGEEEIEEEAVEQYTGLHDKNGKEIYEGDIVKYRDSRGQHIEKVIFDKGCFYAGMHWGSSTRVAPKLINPRITEVIGNEYDNPELLGGE